MPVRAKHIKSYMLEKKSEIFGRDAFTDGFNEAIDQMSNRSLGLSREKLIVACWNIVKDMRIATQLADAIISQEHNLLESREGK